MSTNSSIIFSKRYTDAGTEIRRHEAEHAPTEEEKAEANVILARFAKKEAAGVFAKKGGREDELKKLTELAKEFSEGYEIDTDISEMPDFVEICFYLSFSEYGENFTRSLSQLLGMSDRCALRPPALDGADAALILEFGTHDII